MTLEGAPKSAADHEEIIERLERGDRTGAAALRASARRGARGGRLRLTPISEQNEPSAPAPAG
jgi:DNA-binding GntR family transcriptional regulator